MRPSVSDPSPCASCSPETTRVAASRPLRSWSRPGSAWRLPRTTNDPASRGGRGNLPPGKGPGLHQHPYAETCVVLSGQAAMVVDGEEVVAGTGDIVVIGSATPHCFTAIGDERLDMVCVHASD